MTISHLVIMNISKNSGYLCVNHIFIYIFVISSSVMAKRPKKIDEWICSAQKETGDTRGLKKNTDLRSSEGAQSAHWYYRVHLNSGNVNQPVSHCFSPGLLACS